MNRVIIIINYNEKHTQNCAFFNSFTTFNQICQLSYETIHMFLFMTRFMLDRLYLGMGDCVRGLGGCLGLVRGEFVLARTGFGVGRADASTQNPSRASPKTIRTGPPKTPKPPQPPNPTPNAPTQPTEPEYPTYHAANPSCLYPKPQMHTPKPIASNPKTPLPSPKSNPN